MSEFEQTVSYGQRLITFQLSRRARKTVRVQVHPDGAVRVIAPLDYPADEVSKVVRRKAAWIVKQLRFFEQFRPLTPPRQYRSGETHRYLGRQYRLKLTVGDKRIRLMAGFIEISEPDLDQEGIRNSLDTWYRQKATIYFQRMLTASLARFESYGLAIPQLKLRHMPTRWGSCTPSGVIYLNPDLIRAPGSCIEYVVIHEICHLINRNHDQTFYQLLERILPDWQKRKQTLERIMA
ncbi:M48 family metallopeptidase [Fibrella aquatica]|uniref:M48 family metallopeptidase n=1 Tax=Fibrella aquatica TaxID=3242487 RepID=UPI0035220110